MAAGALVGGIISALGAGASALSGGLSGRAGRKAARYTADTQYRTAMESMNLQNSANRDLAQYQNEYNTEMWNRQNEYNSPAAQMQRYKAAGLNPSLMYSQGSPGLAGSPEPAASYAPDYSMYQSRSGRGGVTFQHPDYGRIVSGLIGTLSQLEDLRSKSLSNEASSLQNTYLGDSLNVRNLNSWNKFYWSGGIPSADTFSNISKARYDQLLGQRDYTVNSVNDLLSRTSLTKEQIKNAGFSRRLMSSQASHLDLMMEEFRRTERAWTDILGKWKKPLFGLSDVLTKSLPSFLK